MLLPAILGFLTLFINSEVNADCNAQASLTSDAHRLKDCLFQNYDTSVRPVKDQSKPVEVFIKLYIRFVTFIEHSDVLMVHSYTLWRWKDEFLTWNPDDYVDIEMLKVDSYSLWTPDVSLYTVSTMSFHESDFGSTTCTLKPTGIVTCLPPTEYYSKCVPDLRNWPFDKHSCIMIMGSWSHGASSLNLSLIGNGVYAMSNMIEDREWKLNNVSLKLKRVGNDEYDVPQLRFTFELERHSGTYIATIIVPGFILAALNMLAWFLSADSGERLLLYVVSIVMHCVQLTYMAMILPSCGENPPKVVTLYRDSLLLGAISLIGTIISSALFNATRPPPAWLKSAISTPTTRLILLMGSSPQTQLVEEGEGLVNESTEEKPPMEWQSASRLLDRVCAFLTAFSYFILFIVTVPT